VKVLLDENFPLGLLRTLRADGVHTDHVITLGWRGIPDSELRARVQDPDVIFLTQDAEFLTADTAPFAVVKVSRIQSLNVSPFVTEQFAS
jgi:predicted nuclease of predicted toxin-antitoxin system